MSNSLIFERVKNILLEIPEAREIKNNKRLFWKYWQLYDGLNDTMTFGMFLQLTPIESISRNIRKVKEKYPELRGTHDSEKMRHDKELEFRDDMRIIDERTIDKRKQLQI